MSINSSCSSGTNSGSLVVPNYNIPAGKKIRILIGFGQSGISNNVGKSIVDIPITNCTVVQVDGSLTYPANEPVQQVMQLNQQFKGNNNNLTIGIQSQPTWVNLGLAIVRKMNASGIWSLSNDHIIYLDCSTGGSGLADGQWVDGLRKILLFRVPEILKLFPTAETHFIFSQGEGDLSPGFSYGGNVNAVSTANRYREIWSWFLNSMPLELETLCASRPKPPGWTYWLHPTLPCGTIGIATNTNRDQNNTLNTSPTNNRMIQYQQELIRMLPGAYLIDRRDVIGSDNVHLTAASINIVADRAIIQYPNGLANTPSTLQRPVKPVQVVGLCYSKTEAEIFWQKDGFDKYPNRVLETSVQIRQGISKNNLPTITNIASNSNGSAIITIDGSYNTPNFVGVKTINSAGDSNLSDVVQLQTDFFTRTTFDANTRLWICPSAAPSSTISQNLVSNTQISGAKARPWAAANVGAAITVTPRTLWAGAATTALFTPWTNCPALKALNLYNQNEGATLTGFDFGNSTGFSIYIDFFMPWGVAQVSSTIWQLLSSSVAGAFEVNISPVNLALYVTINGTTLQLDLTNNVAVKAKIALDGLGPFKRGQLGEIQRLGISVNNTTGRVAFTDFSKDWVGTENTNVGIVNNAVSYSYTNTAYIVPPLTNTMIVGARDNLETSQPIAMLRNLIISAGFDSLDGNRPG